MKKSLALVVALLLVLSIGLTACTPKTPAAVTPTAAPKEAQELTINLFQEVSTLDFQKCSSTGEIQIYNWIMEGLTRSAGKGVVKPGIAETYEQSADGLTWTFHLRDAKWSDGKPVTAADFKYGWMRAIDPKTPMDYTYFLYDIAGAEAYSTGKGTADGVGIKVVDDKTLVVTLSHPVTYFDYLVSFATYAPVRQDIFEKYGDKYNAEAENFITDGPFTVASWKHDTEMVFAKNPNYWDVASIKLDKVTGLMIAETSTEFNMYESGELDSTIALNADQKAALTKGTTGQYADGSVWYFMFNNDDPVLKNANIRKALTFAVDRQSFIDNVAKAPWKPATAFVQPGIIPDADGKTPFRDKTPSYFKDNDVETAKTLLAQGMAELGITKMPTFKFMTNDDSNGQLYAQAFQEMWKKNLGIDVTIEPVPSSVRISRNHAHDYQISLSGWGPDYPDPMTDLNMWIQGSGNNDPNYNNPEYDALIAAANAETDKVKKFDLMHQAEDMLMRDMPIGPLYFRYRDYAVREYVKNYTRDSFAPDIQFIYAYIEGKTK